MQKGDGVVTLNKAALVPENGKPCWHFLLAGRLYVKGEK